MSTLILVVKSLMPASPLLLVVGIALGAALLTVRRTAHWGRRCIVLFAVAYWMFSLPVVADGLASAMSAGMRPLDAQTAADVRAIVVLDGGAERYEGGGEAIEQPNDSSALRALEATRVYSLARNATVVVTSGRFDGLVELRPGGALLDAVVAAGVPSERVVHDVHSPNTRAHAVNVGQLLRNRGVQRFALVTSATHIRRSVAAFRREGLDPIPSPAPMRSAHKRLPQWRRWLPERDSLLITEQAIYDLLGLTYYWARGWA